MSWLWFRLVRAYHRHLQYSARRQRVLRRRRADSLVPARVGVVLVVSALTHVAFLALLVRIADAPFGTADPVVMAFPVAQVTEAAGPTKSASPTRSASEPASRARRRASALSVRDVAEASKPKAPEAVPPLLPDAQASEGPVDVPSQDSTAATVAVKAGLEPVVPVEPVPEVLPRQTTAASVDGERSEVGQASEVGTTAVTTPASPSSGPAASRETATAGDVSASAAGPSTSPPPSIERGPDRPPPSVVTAGTPREPVQEQETRPDRAEAELATPVAPASAGTDATPSASGRCPRRGAGKADAASSRASEARPAEPGEEGSGRAGYPEPYTRLAATACGSSDASAHGTCSPIARGPLIAGTERTASTSGRTEGRADEATGDSCRRCGQYGGGDGYRGPQSGPSAGGSSSGGAVRRGFGRWPSALDRARARPSPSKRCHGGNAT